MFMRAEPDTSGPTESGVKRVAGGAHGANPARLVAISLDLGSDPAHVFGDGGGVLPLGARLPDLGEQLSVREDLSRRLGEEREEVVLPRGERDGRAAHFHFSRFHVYAELAEVERALGI